MLLKEPIFIEAYTPGQTAQSRVFIDPVEEVVARDLDQVSSALEEVEQAVDRGLHAVGFISYEAASGLDRALRTRETGDLPLVYFGLFKGRKESNDQDKRGRYSIGEWEPSVSPKEYAAAIERIRTYIAAGDTYQVNYTFRLRSRFEGDPLAFYRDICRAQGAAYCGYIDLGHHVLISASPELFFQVRDWYCSTRPMKGTRPRGRWLEEDTSLAAQLRESAKDRAENTMVTDLLRNDLGKISQVGSVQVPALWSMERYPTVWQLTSTVESQLREGVGLVEIFAALFPCGSITGAPKVRTMEIIAELEPHPRGIYTGCLGYWSPGGEACFNVAIRTAHLDREKGELEFGVGGGVTWGSSVEGEYAECLVKAQVLQVRRPVFKLLETVLYEGGEYFLLDRHLERLEKSAEYWGYHCALSEVRNVLTDLAKALGNKRFKVRLTLGNQGGLEVQYQDVGEAGRLKVALAGEKVDSADPFLYHKTTYRDIYEKSLATRPDCDDVILCNERDELTECSIGNLVLECDGVRYTPPIESGLLAGTFRGELLARGKISERVLRVDELTGADALYLINSVRRWVELELV